MICKDCGRMCLPSEGYIIDGEFYCDHCATTCEDCGRYIIKSSSWTYITNDGSYICDDCYCDNYFMCDDCGKVFHNDDGRAINGGNGCVCERCSENYYECIYCGELFSRDEVRETVNEDYICDRCYDRYDWYVCDDCGNAMPSDEAHEVDGYWYCDNCIDDHRDEQVIYSYHDFNAEDFMPRKRLDETTKELFGFELEVSGDKAYAESLQEEMPSVVLMNDGSIVDDGFEIITHPMSRRYIKEVFKDELSRGLEYLRNHYFSGHNKGGMHVHVDYRCLSKGQIGQLVSVLYGTEKDIDTWLCITQRQEEKMKRWSSMESEVLDYDEILEQSYDMPYILREEYEGDDHDRYTALNRDRRTHTYEFRIFNSNLRLERVMKNLECVFALLDYTKLYENEARAVCNTYGFIKYVLEHEEDYPNLYNYFEERKIKDHYGIRYTEQELEAA